MGKRFKKIKEADSQVTKSLDFEKLLSALDQVQNNKKAMQDNKKIIEGNKKAMEDNRKVIDKMNKAFKSKMGIDMLDAEEETEEEKEGDVGAFDVKIKGKKKKKKKGNKVVEENVSPDLPDITKTQLDTNFNEYGDYSIEKFIPDKK